MAEVERFVLVDIGSQSLRLLDRGQVLADYPVSTAANGPGERNGSGCTPRGWHQVRARIGGGCRPGTVFVGRRPTGEVYSPQLAAQQPQRDWILTRILWLSGLQPGFNRLGPVDTMRRYIYIHGCPDGTALGVPGSHGCIRMANDDLIALYEQVETGLRVLIR